MPDIYTPEDPRFGAVRDDNQDDAPAFQAMINFMSEGDIAQLSAGSYRLLSPIVIDKTITMRGVEHPHFLQPASFLHFAASVAGIEVRVKSTLEDLYLNSDGGTGAEHHGIFARGSVRIAGCRIDDFPGHGIAIDSSTALDGTEFNCNHWEIHTTRIVGNGGHGLFINGPRSNAGLALKVDSRGNTGNGVFESSFLGNTFVACHTSGNARGYETDPNSNVQRSIFIGCYAEHDQGASIINYPARQFGGDGQWTGTGLAVGADCSAGRAAEFFNLHDPTNRVEFAIGGNTSPQGGYATIYGFKCRDNGPRGDARQYHKQFIRNGTPGGFGNWFVLRLGNTFDAVVDAESGENARDTSGQVLGHGQKWLPNGFYYGRPAEMWKMNAERRGGVRATTFRDPQGSVRGIAWAAAMPASGAGWNLGDIVFNSEPAAGRPMGWMYAGNGVWTTMPSLLP